MSLRNNLELIIEYPQPQGNYRCRGFHNLRLPVPVYVAFDGGSPGDQGVACDLGERLCEEVLRFLGATEEDSMPCQGSRAGLDCHALSENTCLKLHVRPAASSGAGPTAHFPSPSADPIWSGRTQEATWRVIPILPANCTVLRHIPPGWTAINAGFYNRDPGETLWHIIRCIGLAPEESRLFISYVRRDTSPVADQLFAELTQSGFDVFLDRCSVPVGAFFQQHLMQDLCDKAMVVLLNSVNVANSEWVGEEITLIKTHRLGLLELRFPGATERKDIDRDFTMDIDRQDLEPSPNAGAGNLKQLTASTLKTVVAQIKHVHAHALHRRRYELIDSFAGSLAKNGRMAQMLPDGTFVLPPMGGRSGSAVNLIPRPPELQDYCALHQRGSISSSHPGWLVSPAPFFLNRRQAQISWLKNVSHIEHVDEAQLTRLAAML